MGNTTGMSDTTDVHTVNTYACYRSYSESNRETVKYPMDSPQDCVGGNQNPEVPGRDQRTGLQIDILFSRMTA